jgi:outer membrane protein assembly factor BamB
VRTVAAALVAAAALLVLAGCTTGPDRDTDSVQSADRDLLVGRSPVRIAVGGGGVWVIDDGDRSLRRFTVKPLRAAPGPPIGLAATPVDASASARGVFVVTRDSPKLMRIDPATGTITSSTPLPADPVAVDAGDREVYVVLKDRTLVKADLKTGALLPPVFKLPFEPSFVSSRDFAVWVGSKSTKRVARIDQSTGKIRRTFRVPNALEGMAAGDGGTLWFAQGSNEPYGHIPVEGDYIELDDPGDTDGSFLITVGPRGTVFVVGRESSASSSSGGSGSSTTYYFRQGLIVDPKTGDLRSQFQVSDDVRDIAAGYGAVWTLEPATGNVPSGSWRISHHPIG